MTGANEKHSIGVVQIGINTCDMAGTLRLYTEVFGYHNAGAQAAWGEILQVQGLGPEARCILWWLVGGQEFFQFEVFQHTLPPQKLKADSWLPSEIGWSGFGIEVEDFSVSQSKLRSFDVPFRLTVSTAGARRGFFIDPFVKILIELIERPPKGGLVPSGPAVAYVTRSVANLNHARSFYEDVMQLGIQSLDTLRDEASATAWSGTGIERSGFVIETFGPAIEVVHYSPVGRARPPDHSIGDQGIVNVALGSRNKDSIIRVIDAHLMKSGVELTVIDAPGMTATYLLDPEIELELVSVPKELDSALGFVQASPFFGFTTAHSEGLRLKKVRSPIRY